MQATLIFVGGCQVWYLITDKYPTVVKQEDYALSIMARDFKGMNNHGANIVIEIYEVDSEI